MNAEQLQSLDILSQLVELQNDRFNLWNSRDIDSIHITRIKLDIIDKKLARLWELRRMQLARATPQIPPKRRGISLPKPPKKT